MNKKGEPSKSKIISIFDNTGYRSFAGIPIQIFDNEKECRDSFVSQAEDIGRRIDHKIASAKKYWEDERKKLITK